MQKKDKWFKIGDLWCPNRPVISANCKRSEDLESGVDRINPKPTMKSSTCKGFGVISGTVPNYGTPEDNEYFQPDVVNSWCWNTEYDYCQCDCSIYEDKKSCNTGYLEFNNTNCGPNCYCWGCNWV